MQGINPFSKDKAPPYLPDKPEKVETIPVGNPYRTQAFEGGLNPDVLDFMQGTYKVKLTGVEIGAGLVDGLELTLRDKKYDCSLFLRFPKDLPKHCNVAAASRVNEAEFEITVRRIK